MMLRGLTTVHIWDVIDEWFMVFNRVNGRRRQFGWWAVHDYIILLFHDVVNSARIFQWLSQHFSPPIAKFILVRIEKFKLKKR